MGRSTTGTPLRWSLGRSALATALLPAIVLFPAFDAGALLIHAHGPHGEHVHHVPEALAAHADVDHAHLREWHDSQHGHDHDDGGPGIPDDRDSRSSPGARLVRLSWHAIPTQVGPIRSSLGSTPYSPAPVVAIWSVFGRGQVQRWKIFVAERPPPWASSGAIAALLRTSHALLI